MIAPIFTVRLLQFAIEPQRFPQDAPVWPELPQLAISAWVNPLLSLYLVTCVVKKIVRVRRFLAGLIVLDLVATWMFLEREHFKLLPGHYLWVIGIVLILAAPFVGRLQTNRP